MSAAVLVVDDHESAAEGLAHELRGLYDVTVARTVADALRALRARAFAVVVLDLLLDVDASPLHRALVLGGTPVVAVSGLEAEAAQTIARVWGWPSLAKPPAPHALAAAVAAALETPMPEKHTPTIAPPPPTEVEPLPAPPAVPADAGDSVSPLAATDARVAVAEAWSRTLRRSIATLAVTGLALYFESRGHSVPLPVVGALTLLGVGVGGAIAAMRKRPGVAAGGAAGLLALAAGGTLLGEGDVNLIATLGAGAIPVVDLLADRMRL